MRRDQLEHAIRTACQITGLTEVIIVGSQAILGTFAEDELPFYATRSLEIDVLPIASDDGEIARLADAIEGIAGELSPTGWSVKAVASMRERNRPCQSIPGKVPPGGARSASPTRRTQPIADISGNSLQT